ncbi:MAG: type II toxin-antitoxin system RelE/ParE family toxin [Anaerolineae bacterium]|nr:type II toxin-antitoxin system RelE/ParE family toxin [Anaerolineae bacterium]
MYRVESPVTRLKRELRRIPVADRPRIVKAMQSLAKNPRPDGIKQLAPGVYRLRVGRYRVIYKVLDDEQLVLIGRVARRSEATYRGLGRLFG